MRVSTWQQFSSNHSSHFTVVGRFRDEEEAERITQQLRQWMNEILFTDTGKEREKQISETYNLDWYEDGVDWNGPSQADLTRIVKRVRNDVFLQTTVETWNYGQPFAGLMWKLGAQAADYAYGELIVLSATIVCDAPDEATAIAFCRDTQEYLDQPLKRNAPAWFSYGQGKRASTFGSVIRDGQHIQMFIQFGVFHVAEDYEALILYLEANGYQNISSFWYPTVEKEPSPKPKL
jgi:hypothetical protein